jgi:hypothetical protein
MILPLSREELRTDCPSDARTIRCSHIVAKHNYMQSAYIVSQIVIPVKRELSAFRVDGSPGGGQEAAASAWGTTLRKKLP